MESLAMLAVISLFSTIIGGAISLQQQDKEFSEQEKLLKNQQDFSQQQTEWLWQHQRPQQVMQDYLSLGFNPNLAAQSIMGVGGETAQSASSPSAPSVNSAINALQSMVGQGGQNLYDMFKNQAEIDNINADTTLKKVDAGLKPKEFDLKKLSTDEQIKVWDKSVEKMAAEIGVDAQLIERYKKEVYYYGQMAESEIASYQQSVKESIKRCKVMDEEIKNKSKQRDLMDSEIMVNQSQAAVNYAQETKIYQESYGQEIENDRNNIALEFERSVNAPLTTSDKQYVNKLLREGKYDEVEQFYDCIFEIARHQDPPHKKVGLPWHLYSFEQREHPVDDMHSKRMMMRQRPNSTIWNRHLE